MAMRIRYNRGVTFFFAITLCCAALPVHSQEHPSEDPIIVKFHQVQGKWALTVIPDPTPEKGNLWALSTLINQRGAEYPVVALVDDNAKISDLNAAWGVAAKAGFTNIRTFIVRREAGVMVE